ncbi:unnamed protein product [Candida verbasci]|uniref:STAS domain-containing protein n=1 Tax=Candida verbasci TaxID=1227364 RepID=A0A9W4TYD8_9ASCO|nr:unnamed protein product [Candida verbasci]
MPDENTKLLSINRSSTPPTPNIRFDKSLSRPSSSRSINRPPLLSVGSSHSLKSFKSSTSLNEPLIEDYINKYKKNSDKDGNEDSLSILDFELFNKLNNNGSEIDIFAYLSYYIPILNWLPKYNFKQSLIGDLLAGISLASFQIPLVMSIAISLAHLPPISGLYAMIISSLIYAIFGTVPILIVGPSPSTAVIYGQLIEIIQHDSKFLDFSIIEISSCLTFGLSGILLGCGIFRLGYLDNVLSRALLKGFIAAMGLIMIINQFSTELGLDKLAIGQPHITTIDKLVFIFKNYHHTHGLTFLISAISLTLVMSIRVLKSKLVKTHKSAVYFPELLLMIVIATFLCYHFYWFKKGVEIIGNIKKGDTKFSIQNPFQTSKLKIYKNTFTTFFLCTILGYFDSITAVKALGAKYNYNVSSNRELIALGVINFFNSLFMGLPSFGALGRSKLNISSGATSPMSGIFMSITSIITVLYLLPYFYYLPQCVLALTTTIIGLTVLAEIPSDLIFYFNIQGYHEIITFLLIFSLTIFWSAEAGVTFGIILSIIKLIKNSSISNIQILGRVPKTFAFRDIDTLIEESFQHFDSNHTFNSLIAEIEEIEGVIIIKIPEPLNFSNINNLKDKLSRIERYGTLLVHPSQPSIKEINSIKFIIFDCKGLIKIDVSALQILNEIIKRYIDEGILILFSRVSTNEKFRDKLKKSGILKMINDQDIAHNGLNTASGLGNGFYLSIDDALKSIDYNV